MCLVKYLFDILFNSTFIDVTVSCVENSLSKTIKTICFLTKINSNSYLEFITNLILKLNCFINCPSEKNC